MNLSNFLKVNLFKNKFLAQSIYYQQANYKQQHVIDFKNVGLRVDNIIQNNYNVQWNTIRKLNRKKKIYVQVNKNQVDNDVDQNLENQQNEQKITKIRDLSYRVQLGDTIILPTSIDKLGDTQQKQLIKNPVIEEQELKNKDLQNEEYKESIIQEFKQMIFFESLNFIVINKEQDYASQGGDDYFKNLYTIGSIYLERQSQLFNKQFSYYIVHRLDKVTTGSLIIAKNKQASQQFGKLFREKEEQLLEKYYIAAVYGSPQQYMGNIDLPLIYKNYKCKPGNYTEDKLKESQTFYKVLGQINFDRQNNIVNSDIYNLEDNNLNKLNYTQKNLQYGDQKQYKTISLLKIRIKDGRKHQIRAHMQYALKTPVLGDFRYGFDKNIGKQMKLHPDNTFLHCYQINIVNQKEIQQDVESQLNNQIVQNQNNKINIIKSNNNSDITVQFTSDFPLYFKELIGLSYKENEQQQQIYDLIQNTYF